jgi:hypothetical protein
MVTLGENDAATAVYVVEARVLVTSREEVVLIPGDDMAMVETLVIDVKETEDPDVV